MNFRADPGDGFSRAPLENQTHKEFHQFMGSWIPVTPRKPLQGRSSLILDERNVQDLNHAGQGMDQSYQGVTNINRMVNNNLAGSYAQGRSSIGGDDLLGKSNAASVLAPNTTWSVEPPFNGNSDAGMVKGSFTQSGVSQAGYGAFELDHLLNPDQMPFSFTSLLSDGDNLFQAPKYGNPACSRPLYNLNSPPRREAVGSICESSSQPVPSTPSLCRKGQENGFLEQMIKTTGNEVTGEKSDKSSQSIVDSSAVNSKEVTEQKDGDGQIDLGFDLNKTPQQKTSKRRKKFMPKVVREDKPKRKPRKPAATQEKVKAKETTGSGKRKKTTLKESTTEKAAIDGDTSNPIPKIRRQSCRKSLKFDLEKAGDVGQGDSESEIVQNTSGSNSFTGGTSGSCLDSLSQMDQTNGLVTMNQPLEASMGNQSDILSTGAKLPRVSEENHTRMLAWDQQPESLTGNQQRQFPVVNQNTQLPMGNQQALLQMKNQLIGFPFSNQQPQMTMPNHQPHLAMGNQQPMYLRGTSRPALTSGNQQQGGIQGNKLTSLPVGYQQTQQTFLPAGYQQYGPPKGMPQRVVSTGGQQHGVLMNNQKPEILLRNQQPGSSMRSQQPYLPLMNQMASACMPSTGLPPHSQSQIPATNLHVGSVSRSSIGTAGTCQRSSNPEYGSSQQVIHQANGYIPLQGRSQNSSLPTSVLANLVEARGLKRQCDHAMGQMQNHDLNQVGRRWNLLQHIAQLQDMERQDNRMGAEYLDAAKKMKVQKVVQEKLHGMPSEVIQILDDPTDVGRKDKSIASINETASKGISSVAQSSADNEKCVVPKTPAKKGRPGRKKSVTPKVPARRKKSVPPPPAHASEIQLWEPTPPAKKPSSRNKAKEKGKKPRGPSGDLLSEASIAEIIKRLQNIYIEETSREHENALVLYKGDGALIPYEAKKKKPRPKVDLDEETTRVWNLLMGIGDTDEEMDKKKEKWWQNERSVFKGRADSFISKMHLVQGDRRFSPWKGSVVDSVIGVFLTQNVSDHLSSSAFMSLAARFPPKASNNKEDERSSKSVIVEDPEGCILNLNETPSWQEMVQNPSETQVSGVDSGSKEPQRDSSNSGIERFSFLDNSSQSLEEEVLSSQDSFDPAIFQSFRRVGSSSGSKSDAEFSPARSETKTASGSVQSVRTGSPNLSDLIQEIANVTQKGTNFSSSYEQSPIQEAQVIDIEDFAGMGYSWQSVSPKADKGKNKKARVVKRGGKGQIITPNETPGMGLSASSSTSQDVVESDSGNKEQTTVEYKETNATIVREMKGTLADGKKTTSHWDNLRKDVERNLGKKERSDDSKDSIDYEAIRRATVAEISDAIRERGMNNMLAVRIKDFLDRIVKDHGAIDLEWLRDVPADKAKDYLLSIRGLGLKSVECVRLLTLHNLAFPVDTNVGRIAVRLGWVPLQPLPESLQLHLLELYPVLESIQKYLWPRLCTLDQRTLYELHYQLITFGKVFCTKSRPNCNACPMRRDCRHFDSAYASARRALPAPDSERSLTTATVPVPPESFPHPQPIPMMELPPPPLESDVTMEGPSSNKGNCEPIIEMPASPEPPEYTEELTEKDIEDHYYNGDPDEEEIPTVKICIEELGMTLEDFGGDMSKALVALDPGTASIPTPKLKNISRLRTEHQVYELPESHPLLAGMDKRERDDPSPYLLAIWTPGETADSAEPPELKCGGQASGKLCSDESCSECNAVRESKSRTVRGTLLIPCRTATRGSFPLNGTYFQVNEVFADHKSSLEPIEVPREWLWNLDRRTVFFGTSVTSIFRGLSTEQIQYCFWKGFVCVRGFDQETRAPRPLMARLHFTASKVKKNKKT